MKDLLKITRRKAALLAAGAMLIGASGAIAAEPVYKEFVTGDAKAKITVIEYASLTCPHCAQFMIEGYPQLKKDYIDTGKVKFVYRDFPLDGLALGAATLARCVPNDRGKVMVELMFKNQGDWLHSDKPLELLRGYAQLAGMDSAGVDACLKNEAIVKQIRDVQERATTVFKVESTPTFFVGEDKVAGNDYAALKKAIDKLVK